MLTMKGAKSGFINDENLILGTDFYELTMGAAYYQYNLENNIKEEDDIAVFDIFIRKYPKNRNYLIFAGLEQVIHYLQTARFTEKAIEFLRKKEVFKEIYMFEMELKKKYKLSMNEVLTICILENSNRFSGEMAEEIGISVSRMSRVFMSLEKKGFVLRELGEKDKRKMLFKLSKRGKDLAKLIKNDDMPMPDIRLVK